MLGNFKYSKVRTYTILKNKTLGLGVGTLLPLSVKNFFRDDLIMYDQEIVWNEIKTEGKKVLAENIYVPPNNEEQLHTFDKVLDSFKNEIIILLGDFNARNSVWDKHVKQNTKLGAILGDVIQRLSIYIALNVNHTHHHSRSCEQSDKSAIGLILSRVYKT